MRRMTPVLFSILVLLLATLAVSAEIMHCTECGMMVEPTSKFSSRIMQKDRSLPFCDIGDLLVYLNKNKPHDIRPEVKDYASGAWMDASAAFYVRADKKFQSPMGWAIAAFKNKKDAAAYGQVMDLDAALKAVR